jgi:hypothetical protein
LTGVPWGSGSIPVSELRKAGCRCVSRGSLFRLRRRGTKIWFCLCFSSWFHRSKFTFFVRQPSFKGVPERNLFPSSSVEQRGQTRGTVSLHPLRRSMVWTQFEYLFLLPLSCWLSRTHCRKNWRGRSHAESSVRLDCQACAESDLPEVPRADVAPAYRARQTRARQTYIRMYTLSQRGSDDREVSVSPWSNSEPVSIHRLWRKPMQCPRLHRSIGKTRSSASSELIKPRRREQNEPSAAWQRSGAISRLASSASKKAGGIECATIRHSGRFGSTLLYLKRRQHRQSQRLPDVLRAPFKPHRSSPCEL